MKKLFYSTALLLALFATSCGDANQKTSAIPQIDMNADYPEKEICLQDIAEVSYIALDSKDEFLFRGKMEEVSSDGIAVIGDDKIYLFHPDGEARNIIDKKGQGPDEYPFVHYALLDWKKDEVFVHAYSAKQMLVYSLDGKIKRQFKLEEKLVQHDLMNGDAEYMVMFKEKPGENKEGKVEPPYRPIVRISKVDGTVDSLSYQQDYYTGMRIHVQTGDGNPITMCLPSPSLMRLNGEVYVNEVSSDTIYRIVGEELRPVMTRIPSVEMEMKEKRFLKMYGATSRYFFLRRVMQDYVFNSTLGVYDSVEVEGGSGWLLYDKVTGDTFVAKFNNQDFQGELLYRSLSFNECDANTAYLKLEAFKLVEALEAGELSGELKTIAEGLKEDDNPVLMVVKFKE